MLQLLRESRLKVGTRAKLQVASAQTTLRVEKLNAIKLRWALKALLCELNRMGSSLHILQYSLA